MSQSRPSDADPKLLQLVGDLEQRFRSQVERALQFPLDGSVTSLAVVDHYLALARDERRPAILALLAAGAGAYFGELLRREFGGQWIGSPGDPRTLRMLLGAQFLSCAPVDLAMAAIVAADLDPEDPRMTGDEPLDLQLHLDTRRGPPIGPREAPEEDEDDADDADDEADAAPADARPPDDDDDADDASWVMQRLEALAPVPEDQFYSLTTRFETIALIVGWLAERRARAGYEPYTYTLEDYLHALS